MKITKEIYTKYMKLKNNEVVDAYAIPGICDDDTAEWANPDEQYTIKFDAKTQTLTGMYYEWDEKAEDWVDGDVMTDDELRALVEKRSFLLV